MTTCARCGRCSRRPRPFSARSTGRVSSASSTSGSRAREIPVGHGQTPPRLCRRRVPGLLARRRWGAGVLEADAGPAVRASALLVVAWRAARTLVWDREGRSTPAAVARRRRSRPSAASCGRLAVLRGARPAGQGRRRAPAGLRGANFEPGRGFANELDFQLQLDDWFAQRQRAHAQDAALPPDRPARRGARRDGAAAGRLAGRRAPLGAARPARSPTCALTPTTTRSTRALRAGASRFGSPRREVKAVALDTGELAGRHRRSFAKHRTITALEHARALATARRRAGRARGRDPVPGHL